LGKLGGFPRLSYRSIVITLRNLVLPRPTHVQKAEIEIMEPLDWRELQSIFQQAVALPQEDRKEFLDRVCDGNLDLRNEIEALLIADQSQELVDSPLKLDIANLDSKLVGSVIDDWKIIRQIGVGGMGTVFLAHRHTTDFQQSAALKLVKKGMDSEAVVQRFQQERKILASLNHKNIAKLLDGGMTQDGRPYFVMEHVDGLPITQYCDQHRLNISQRLNLFRAVCSAVHHAHKNLIVHRDLKPSNIIVTGSGDLKLLDFGIAKLLDDSENQQFTRTGMQLHTPAYASPEQLINDPITTASDIYALGILFYELLTGRRPFEIKRSEQEFRELVLTGQPVKPSDAVTEIVSITNKTQTAETISQCRSTRVQGLKRTLAGDLDTICMMAMHREADRRYTSASEFALDIQRHLDGLPVSARPDSRVYRLNKFIKRNKASVSIASLAVLSIILITIFYTSQLKLQRDIAIKERQKSEEVVRFVTGLFEYSKPSRRLGQDISAKDLLDEGANRIQFELVDQPLVQQTLKQVLGEVYYKLGQEQKALDLLTDALAKQRELLGENHLDVATTKLVLALVHQDRGHYDFAAELLSQALQTKKKLLGELHFDVAEVLSVFAYMEQMRGGYPQAETYFKKGLDISEQLSNGDNVYLAKLTKQLGGFYRYLDRNSEAEPLLRKALAMQVRIYQGGPHPDINSTKRELAALLRSTGEYQESKRLYLEVIESRTKILGPDHPELGNTWNSYSLLLTRMDDYEGALAANIRFIEILKRAYSEATPSLAAAYFNQASMLRDLDRYSEAIKHYRLASETQDLVGLPEKHVHRAFPIAGIASVYVDQKNYEEATQLYRKVLALRRESLSDDHKTVIDAKNSLGGALTGLKRYKEAEELLLESYQQSLKTRGSKDGRTQRAMRKLIELYKASGQSNQVEEFSKLLLESQSTE
jgi:eukaryotic-like serine/threonine-protein kinase